MWRSCFPSRHRRPLASFAYDDLGRRTGLSRIFGTSTSWSYDPISRLSSLAHDFAGTSSDVSWTFAYNPASQIISSTRSNDAYAWTGHGSGSTAGVANGLNQLASIGGAATAHDTRGNLTTDPTTGRTYGYSSENLLTSASGGVALSYDPLGRLYQSSDGVTVRRFHYAIGESGLYEAVGEYDPMGSVRSHHAFGPGVDEPILWWDGTQSFAIKPLHADERGSIVAISDSTGAAATINRYDEYGKPQPGNVGLFQYTGQMWRPEIGLYHYKARAYAPHLGRFMQTDPIGYAGGINLYAYVGNDPVNWVDPLGLCGVTGGSSGTDHWVSISYCRPNFGLGSAGAGSGRGAAGSGGDPLSENIRKKIEGNENKDKRDCTEFQKKMEKIADLAGMSSNLSADLSVVTLGGAGIATAVGAEPAALALGRASIHFYAQSAFWGTVSEIADFASGNYSKTIGQRIQGALLDQMLRRIPKNMRDKIKNEVNDASKSPRCK